MAPFEADAQLAYLSSIPEHVGGVAAGAPQSACMLPNHWLRRLAQVACARVPSSPLASLTCCPPSRILPRPAVVSEDSDLVAYGCRQILFKMDT